MDRVMLLVELVLAGALISDGRGYGYYGNGYGNGNGCGGGNGSGNGNGYGTGNGTGNGDGNGNGGGNGNGYDIRDLGHIRPRTTSVARWST